MDSFKSKSSRSSKIIRSQFELYIEELRSNKAFRNNIFDGSDPDIIKRSWENLCNSLSLFLGGPIRDVVGWKRVFSHWKSQTRLRARKLRQVQTETGNTEPPPKILTYLEEQLHDLTGRVVIHGMADVREIGIGEPIYSNVVDDVASNKKVEAKENVQAGLSGLHNSSTKIATAKRKSLYGCLQDIINQSIQKGGEGELLAVLEGLLERCSFLKTSSQRNT